MHSSPVTYNRVRHRLMWQLRMAALICTVCCAVSAQAATSDPIPRTGYTEKGIASVYPGVATKQHHGLTMAHKKWRKGTLVQVTNLKNGKTMCGPVTDHGPFVKGRIVDVSYGAAKKLGFPINKRGLPDGLARVSIEVVASCPS